jgi:hypothetical protein
MSEIADRLQEQKDFTLELAKEAFPDMPKFYFRWSKRMTRAAGNITWHSHYTEIKLSVKIFWKKAQDDGIDAACEELHETFLHEIGHLMTGEPGHGSTWREFVSAMGGHPTQYHDMKTGVELVADTGTRRQFYIGAQVAFEYKGRTIAGRIIKHNPKNIRIAAQDGTQWNMPWSIANDKLST